MNIIDYEIIDLTEQIKDKILPYVNETCKNINISVFNPSIVNIGKDKGYLSVRIMANKICSQDCQDIPDAVSSSINDWKSVVDHTCFFNINLQTKRVGNICFINRAGDVFMENCVDARLFNGYNYKKKKFYCSEENQLILTYNRYLNCSILYISNILVLDDRGDTVFYIADQNPICKNLFSLTPPTDDDTWENPISKFEKNWTPFFVDNTNGDLYISQWLSKQGKHVYFQYNFDSLTCSNPIIANSRIVINNNKDIHNSLGTVGVPLTHTTILAVGHAKINEKNCHVGTEEIFTYPQKEYKKHHDEKRRFRYFMFFYELEFNDTTKLYHLSRVSAYFIPYTDQDYNRMIYFPTGLCRFGNDKFILTYGIGDSESKMLVFNEGFVNNLFNLYNPNQSRLEIFSHGKEFLKPQRGQLRQMIKPQRGQLRQMIKPQREKFKPTYRDLTLHEDLNKDLEKKHPVRIRSKTTNSFGTFSCGDLYLKNGKYYINLCKQCKQRQALQKIKIKNKFKKIKK
jgi:hypothetical protein